MRPEDTQIASGRPEPETDAEFMKRMRDIDPWKPFGSGSELDRLLSLARRGMEADALTAEVERLRADVTDFQATVDYLEADYATCCTNKNRLTARVAELEAALDDAISYIVGDISGSAQRAGIIKQARAALTQPAPSAWKPMETAPKDGTIFLATEGSAMVTTYWHRNQWKAVDWANPTHWMPLPPPPEKGGE
jgi:hypothetical protein